jgi:hypothetical protein
MSLPIIIFVILVILISDATILTLWSRSRFRQMVAKETAKILANAQHNDAVVRHEDLGHLPVPVQRYIRRCVPDGHEVANTVRLTQEGAMSLSPGSDWKSFQASQVFTSSPPAFVWSAELQLLPFVWVSARDIYQQQTGNMLVKVLSLFTVADAKGGNTASGAFTRFLAEMMWFPSAMVYRDDVTWRSIDDYHASIVMRDGDLEIDVIFTFNDEGDMVRAESNNRYRDDNDTEPTPWYGVCQAYDTFNGVRMPSEVKVCWGLPEGEYAYWRGKIKALETNFA